MAYNDDSLIIFIEDFTSLNPTPSNEDLEALGYSIGLEPSEIKYFIKCAKKKIRALTEDEAVLNNEFNKYDTSSNDLLLIDGDEKNANPGLQKELSVDGVDWGDVYTFDQKALENDGI